MELILTTFVLFDNYNECVDERTVHISNVYMHIETLIHKFGTTYKIVVRPIA